MSVYQTVYSQLTLIADNLCFNKNLIFQPHARAMRSGGGPGGGALNGNGSFKAYGRSLRREFLKRGCNWWSLRRVDGVRGLSNSLASEQRGDSMW